MSRPAKKPKIELLPEEIRALIKEQDEKLKQKDKALQAAMTMVCDPRNIPFGWGSMPSELRNDPTAVTQAILSQKSFHRMKRSEIPEQVLQDLLPNLLENHRQDAIKACVAGLLTWEEVDPTPDEWRESDILSVQALRRGLVGQDPRDAPALTSKVLKDALKQNLLDWSHIPAHFQNDQDFCRSVLELEWNVCCCLNSEHPLISIAAHVF